MELLQALVVGVVVGVSYALLALGVTLALRLQESAASLLRWGYLRMEEVKQGVSRRRHWRTR